MPEIGQGVRELKSRKESDQGRMRAHRLLFLGLWALSLVSISFFGGAVSYGFFFGMTLLPVVSLCYILCVYFRFKIYQELGSRSMVCGEPEPYFFILQNEDFFAFTGVGIRLFSDFSYVEELPGDGEYELLPGDRFTYRTRLVCKYRGEYEVGVKEVVVTDFLRLFRVRYTNPGTIKALVRPRVVRLSSLRGAEEFQVPLQREAFGETEPDVLVREYAAGDSLRQIHWKTSAREGHLMTRTRIGEEKQGISVFCDMNRFGRKAEAYLPLENRMLEALLALVFFFAGKNVSLSAYYWQDGLVRQRVQGMKDFEGFYQSAAETVFGECRGIPEMLELVRAQGGLWDNRMVFFILHEPGEKIMAAAEELAAGGVAVVIYVVTDEEVQEYVRQAQGRKRMIVIPVEGPLEGRM